MRKFIAIALAAMAVVALAAAPAFAEGYNSDQGGLDPNGGQGIYVRTPVSGSTTQVASFSGPHGGYTTTTNKCQDCHSTHYAYGSYKLLRANEAEAACDYCHGGGGGSTINVQMDNQYRDGGFDPYGADGLHTESDEASMAASAIASDSMGPGTGHTLGYEGLAPADIEPAYTAGDAGFACFSCHSPHGNSARILTTFSDPGRHFAGPGQEGRPLTANLNGAAPTANWPIKGGFGNGDKDGLLENGEWGVDYEYGNFVWDGDATAAFSLRYRPIWPSGRFLLLKNPHAESVGGVEIADTQVAAVGALASAGVNKYKIDWDEPLGPADVSYGGGQNNDNDNAFPFAPKETSDSDGLGYDGNGQLDGGFLSESEFCTDCHDGTAGASTQKALVYNPTESTYTVAFSHDAQPRH